MDLVSAERNPAVDGLAMRIGNVQVLYLSRLEIIASSTMSNAKAKGGSLSPDVALQAVSAVYWDKILVYASQQLPF